MSESSDVAGQVLAGLKVMVALAKADGVVHPNERLAIESELEGLGLPDGTSADALFDAEIDLDAELAAIVSPAIRKQTFDSACALVWVDGEASADERKLLEKIRAAFAFAAADPTGARAHFEQALDRAFAPLAIGASDRSIVVDDEIERAAIFGGALAELTLPSTARGVELGNEVRLAQKIGQFYGRKTDATFWKTFIQNLVGQASSRLAIGALARIAGLGGGSRAPTAYASTRAIGIATKAYFEKEETLDADALRVVFRDAKKEGLTAAKAAKAKIDERRSSLESAKATLDADLAAKKIDDAEYERHLLDHE